MGLQYYLKICHPLSFPASGSPIRVSFVMLSDNFQHKSRRASLGKTYCLPQMPSGFTSRRFHRILGLALIRLLDLLLDAI